MSEVPNNEVSSLQSKEVSDKRLRLFAWGNERFVAKEPQVDGWENYEELVADPEQNFVIASTHRSDAEIQTVVTTFASKRKLGLVTHRANVQNQDGEWGLGPKLIGKDNFLVLGVNRDAAQTTEARANDRYHLDPAEMNIMARRMQDEKMTPVVAAHRPVYHSPLPDSPGIADVILAHLSGSRTILPVAVDWPGGEAAGNSHEMGKVAKNFITRNRPEVAVRIAKAIKLPEIAKDDIDLAMKVLSSESRKDLTTGEREHGLLTLRQLEDQAGLVMRALAEKLPQETRGKWGQVQDEDQSTSGDQIIK